MGNHLDILNYVVKVFKCPRCGKNYQIEDIKIRNVQDGFYVFQAICSHHHQPIITLFVTRFKAKDIEETKPLETDEIIQMHQSLKKFNGNFIKIFGEKND